ncbi:hypothetical protein EVAR_14968_1 [Eumeta japonica]|uniref:Uncharacterized protein n=1 Tax=Eumeta variegata TaxID=151549 RepID=A0A4C1XP48_EUMVA|nr:hypothetical protein EVAR_14968_1 [Eumeta japonica]
MNNNAPAHDASRRGRAAARAPLTYRRRRRPTSLSADGPRVTLQQVTAPVTTRCSRRGCASFERLKTNYGRAWNWIDVNFLDFQDYLAYHRVQ